MKRLLLLTFAAASLIAADATGRWTGTLVHASPGGDRTGPALLVLKQEGEKVTGTAGPDEQGQLPIQNGKLEKGTLTFEVPNGGGLMKFTLKHEGDQIKGDVAAERQGEKLTGKLDVTRQK